MSNPLAKLLVLPSRRPAQTLVYVAGEAVVRLDLDDKGKVLESITLDRATGVPDDLPGAVDAALTAGRSPGRRLWLLSALLPTQSLDLASAQIRDLEPSQLDQALAFELEAMGGVGADLGLLACLPQGEADGLTRFRVTQIPRSVLARIQDLATGAKARLAGLAHPGGLPLQLDAQGRETGGDIAWARLELWPDGLIAVHGTSNGLSAEPGRPQVQSEVCNGGNRPTAWLGEAERWLARQSPVQALCWLQPGTEPPREGELLDIRRPETRRAWLEAWARLLSGRHPETQVPLLRPARGDALGQERDWRLGGILVVLLLCMGHYTWIGARNQDLALETMGLEAAERRLAAAEKGLKTEQDRVRRLQEELLGLDQARERIPWALSVLRRRPLRLLDALSEGRPESLLVSRLSTRADAAAIQGLTLTPGDPDDLAASLSRGLEGLGWQVAPPSKQDLARLPEGGPWSFELRLLDRGLEGWRPGDQGDGG